MKDGFHYPLETDIWFPLAFGTQYTTDRRFHFLRPIVRLKKGVSIYQAQAELDTIAAKLERAYPESNKTFSTKLEPLQQQMVGEMRRPLFIIFAAVCFLFLIACANVANLLLARTTARRRELSIRLALGARRSHILQQLLAESLLLSIPAGLIGLLLAIWSVNTFKIAAPNFVPRLSEVSVDGWTLLFTIAGSLLTAMLVSLAPMLNTFFGFSAEMLADRTSSGTGSNAGKLRSVLAVAEFALSLMLIAGAALLLKSFWQITKVDPGFEPKNLSMVRITLDEERYATGESVVHFIETALDKIRAIPGVEMAAAGNGLPLIAAGGDNFFTIEGRPVPSNEADKPNAQSRVITRDYFKTLSIPVLRGRNFSAEDTETSPKVVIINDALAEKFFKGEDPLGQYVTISNVELLRAQIIGIVSGSRQDLANKPMPEMYLLHQQSPIGFFILAVKSKPGLTGQMQSIRTTLRLLDPTLPLRDFRSMDEIVKEGSARNRLNAILLGGAALIALLLAGIGIYGVLSFSVEQRQQEIGIRMALGAGKNDILQMVLRYGLRLAAIGLILGLAGTAFLTRWMQSLLFEVSPLDPSSLFLGSIILLVAAILACWLPARRATQLDPLKILRHS
jgi:putative ABC transport system permease protein